MNDRFRLRDRRAREAEEARAAAEIEAQLMQLDQHPTASLVVD